MLTFLAQKEAIFLYLGFTASVAGVNDRRYGTRYLYYPITGLQRSYDCDYIGHDFVDAGDFVYPTSGPNRHHWNSIEHFKCQGCILGCDGYTAAAQLGIKPYSDPDAYTGAGYPAIVLLDGSQPYSVGRLHYRWERADVDEYSWSVFTLTRISPTLIAYTTTAMTYAVKWNDGHWSWTYYTPNKVYQSFSVTITLLELSVDLSRVRKFVGTLPPVEIAASPRSGTSLAELTVLGINKYLRSNLRTIQFGRWEPSQLYRLNGLRVPELHTPNRSVFMTPGRRYYNWSALAATAYQDIGMADVNGIAYLKDLFEFGSSCSSFAKTLRAIPSKKVKAAAQTWLSIHYGFKLFYSDTKEILSVLEKETARRSSLSKLTAAEDVQEGEITFRYGYQVFYDQWAQVRSMLEQTQHLLDLGLNLDNLWDMVPYSFVVDWFVNVGSVLKSLQNYAELTQEHKLICAGRTIKASTNLQASQLGLDPAVYTVSGEISYFTRQYRDRLVLPSLVPPVTFNPFDHLVEAAALIISRK